MRDRAAAGVGPPLRLFGHSRSGKLPRMVEKLKCIFHYFERIRRKADLSAKITFTRQVLVTPPDWAYLTDARIGTAPPPWPVRQGAGLGRSPRAPRACAAVRPAHALLPQAP